MDPDAAKAREEVVFRTSLRAPTGVNFSGKATNPRYFNKRSEMHFELAQWVKNGGALPNVPELVGELTTPTYWSDGGRLRLEEKAQIKTRLGRSTMPTR